MSWICRQLGRAWDRLNRLQVFRADGQEIPVYGFDVPAGAGDEVLRLRHDPRDLADVRRALGRVERRAWMGKPALIVRRPCLPLWSARIEYRFSTLAADGIRLHGARVVRGAIPFRRENRPSIVSMWPYRINRL